MDLLKVPREFTSRYLNDGFSGGEKKRAEILQMAMLEPTHRGARRDRLRASTSTRCASSPRASTRCVSAAWAS